MKKIVFKIILFLTLFLSFNTYALAANKLMTCEYNAELLDKTYIKYKVEYYDDDTIKEYGVMDESKEYELIKNASYLSFIRLTETGEIYKTPSGGTSPQNFDKSYFDASSMKEYYEKGECPYIVVYMNGTSSSLSPTGDDYGEGCYEYYCYTKGTTTITKENGEEKVQAEPILTKECNVHIEEGAISNVAGFTMNFSMYDNGKRYFKAYFNRDDDSGQTQEVKDTGATVNLQANGTGKIYQISIPESEVANIFKQSSSQDIHYNTFTCPSKLYVIEDDYTAGQYHLSTDEEEVESYNYAAEAQEGTGDVAFDTNLDFDTSDCSSYLGSVDNPDDPAYYLKFAFNLIKYIAIIALLLLTIIDYVKAVSSSNSDAMKKANLAFIKRLIIAIIIFLLPILLGFLLDLLGVISTDPMCSIT